MGGKSKPTPPPPVSSIPEPPQVDLGPIMSMMSQMMAMVSQQTALPQLPQTPSVFAEPDINWREKQEELRNKIKGDESLADDKRKNRVDTVLTSPLLDEEDAITTKSLLAED